MQEFKYQLKILTRNKIMLFWTLLFPIILATFFNLAFSNLTSSEGFDPVKVAVIENTENTEFKELLNGLSKKGEDQLLEVSYTSEQEAKELLSDDDISAYLTMNEDIEIFVNGSGINETIIQTVVNNYYQMTSTYTNIGELNPQVFATGVLAEVDINANHFKEIANDNTDLTVVYFYTLIGMTCMYGGYWGLTITTNIEGNLSRQGTRITMAPTSKYKVLGTGMLAAFICQFASVAILLAYLTLGLGISFGTNLSLIALLMAVGSFVGIAFGSVIGNVLKSSENTKINVMTSLSMLCSFFAGMMIIDLKYWMQENFIIGTYINPVSLITDALYSLYYYTTNDRYFFNLLCLLAIGIVFTSISILFMRKKQYDSI